MTITVRGIVYVLAILCLLILVAALAAPAHCQVLPDAPAARPFLDRETVAELTISAGALAADGYTTFAAPSRLPETNPLLRIGDAYHSRRGVSLYFGGVFAAEVGGMYAFRRHRWIKRLIPLAVTAVEVSQAVRNRGQHYGGR